MIAAAGLQCGFSHPLGAELLTDVKARGFDIARIDLQPCDLHTTHALAQEVLDVGLQPLCIIRRAEQIPVLPKGSLAELGNEPDISKFGWSADTYRTAIRQCIPIAVEHDIKLYVGVVSNLNRRGFAFLERLDWEGYPASHIAASVHRYPNGSGPTIPHDGFKSRAHEVQRLREIVGPRPLAVTEVGYHDGAIGWTEDRVAEYMAWERSFFSKEGFEVVCAFQLNDGPGHDTESHYGFRRLDGSWKPVAAAFIALPLTD